MCGRYTLRAKLSNLVLLFPDVDWPEIEPRYNVAPTQRVLAVRRIADALKPQAVWLRWGLVPSWAEDVKIGYKLINARADGIADKPSFRAAFRRRRCLIVADGFYEWRKAGKLKQPFHIRRKDEQPFAFAGLWEHWNKGEQDVESCTIITTEANEVVRSLHERMPVILPAKDFTTWLDPKAQDPAILVELLRPYSAEEMSAVQVSTKVNDARHEGPDLLEA